ncbi:MAG TPA: hypothetical protein VHZ03_33265 [Trebonia sp.]|jgi:hypothetical protein|nr:hypothetical protein [Trebonia sp.]
MTDAPELPTLASVVALLYRADWTRLSLSGQVRGSDYALSMVILLTETAPITPLPITAEAPADTVTLRVAPGRRYRRDDALLSAGSDGTRAWQWFPASQAEQGHLTSGTAPPYPTLLCPSWLLTGYNLAVEERVTECGREAIRVTGSPRRAGRAGPAESCPPDLPVPGFQHDRVEAIVDAELGILLRCELATERADGDPGGWLVEFASLDLNPGTDDAVFAPPPGSHSWDATGTGPDPLAAPSALAFLSTFFPWLTSPAAKTIGGLAAGGLGAALRFSPLRLAMRPRAGRPCPPVDEPMPDDGPPFGPGGSASTAGPDGTGEGVASRASVSEDVLALLYRSGAGAPRFTATAHFWANGAGIIAGVPESARSHGLGGVGYLMDTLARDADTTTHQVSRVRIDGWYRYRIERVAGPADSAGPSLLRACNEEKYWEVRTDRVRIDSPRPAPAELADFADASWLLGCELWGGLPVTVNGRAAYRLSVRSRRTQSELLTLGLPAVAAVDAETGRLLWLTCYGHGKPALRWELRDVAEAGPGPASDAGDSDFEFTVPAGLRIVRAGTNDDRPAWPPRAGR